MEQWNGRIKQTFYVLSDHGGYRGKLVVLDDLVTLCIAVHNELVRLRDYRGYKTPEDVHASAVPTSVAVPRGWTVKPARSPKTHAPDMLTGLTTSSIASLSAGLRLPSTFAHDV